MEMVKKQKKIAVMGLRPVVNKSANRRFAKEILARKFRQRHLSLLSKVNESLKKDPYYFTRLSTEIKGAFLEILSTFSPFVG